jgi:hypothetical protein
MRASAALLAAFLLAGCSGGDGGETVVRREAPPPPVRPDPVARYAYVLVPDYARLRQAFIDWLIPCVYIKERDVCIDRNDALASAARRTLARLQPAPPELERADRMLRQGLSDLAHAADYQRRQLVRRDETRYLNSFSPFFQGAIPDVTNGVGEVRAHVPGADLRPLAYVPSEEEPAELRSP